MAHVTGNPTWTNTNATPINAGALEAQEGALDNVHSKVFGPPSGTPNTEIPVCEYRLTTAYTGLATGDYFIQGNMSQIVDNYGMFSPAVTSGTTYPYRVIIPFTGRWNVEWNWFSSQTSGFMAGKVVMNVTGNMTPANAATQLSVMSNVSAATGSTGSEGTWCEINQSRYFVTGDTLCFTIYSSVSFGLPINKFGSLNTNFVVRYVGNK